MGKSTKLTGDPALARDHSDGASVELLQVLAHETLGTIGYRWPRLWVFHLSAHRRAVDALAALHERVRSVPVDAASMRTIVDLELLDALYEAGTGLAIHAVMALQHLCEEIERYLEVELVDADLIARLNSATKIAGIAMAKDTAEYAAFIELLKVRHALEHPRQENVYNGNENEWDKVPLAWALSERSLHAAALFDVFICRLADGWEEARDSLEPQPATFDIAARGVRSQRPFRKPPTG